MTITNFDPTSRWEIRPSGETLDLVRPGMSSVVGRLRGVEVPESRRRGVLLNGQSYFTSKNFRDDDPTTRRKPQRIYARNDCGRDLGETLG